MADKPTNSLRGHSKTNWARIGDIPTNEDLMAGALMRLADKVERLRSKDDDWEFVNSLKRIDITLRRNSDNAEKLYKKERRMQWRVFAALTRYLWLTKYKMNAKKPKTYFSIELFGLKFTIEKPIP